MKKRSWKTSLAGILTIAGALSPMLSNPAKILEPDRLAIIAAGVGGILAKDDGKE